MSLGVLVCTTGFASEAPPRRSSTLFPYTTLFRSATVKLGLVTLVLLSLLLPPGPAESDASVRSGVPPEGAVVSRVISTAQQIAVLPSLTEHVSRLQLEPNEPRSAEVTG